MDFIRRRRLSVFGHIARLTQGTPAHNALHCQVGLASGRSLGRDWRRRPGRPRARWTDQLRNDTGSVPANLWRQAILRGHGERRDGPSWLRDDDDDDGPLCGSKGWEGKEEQGRKDEELKNGYGDEGKGRRGGDTTDRTSINCSSSVFGNDITLIA